MPLQLECPACGYDNLPSELGIGNRDSVVTCQHCGHRFTATDVNEEEDRTQAFESDETAAVNDGGARSRTDAGRGTDQHHTPAPMPIC